MRGWRLRLAVTSLGLCVGLGDVACATKHDAGYSVRPIVDGISATSWTTKFYGVQSWKVFMGRTQFVVTGYDTQGDAVGGYQLAWFKETAVAPAHLRITMLDGTDTAVRFWAGVAKPDGSVSKDQLQFMLHSLYDVQEMDRGGQTAIGQTYRSMPHTQAQAFDMLNEAAVHPDGWLGYVSGGLQVVVGGVVGVVGGVVTMTGFAMVLADAATSDAPPGDLGVGGKTIGEAGFDMMATADNLVASGTAQIVQAWNSDTPATTPPTTTSDPTPPTAQQGADGTVTYGATGDTGATGAAGETGATGATGAATQDQIDSLPSDTCPSCSNPSGELSVNPQNGDVTAPAPSGDPANPTQAPQATTGTPSPTSTSTDTAPSGAPATPGNNGTMPDAPATQGQQPATQGQQNPGTQGQNPATQGQTTQAQATQGQATQGQATQGQGTQGQATQGTATQGGVATQGGATQGGATQGGATQGGATQGSATQGGGSQGGATQGSATQGGGSQGADRPKHHHLHPTALKEASASACSPAYPGSPFLKCP